MSVFTTSACTSRALLSFPTTQQTVEDWSQPYCASVLQSQAAPLPLCQPCLQKDFPTLMPLNRWLSSSLNSPLQPTPTPSRSPPHPPAPRGLGNEGQGPARMEKRTGYACWEERMGLKDRGLRRVQTFGDSSSRLRKPLLRESQPIGLAVHQEETKYSSGWHHTACPMFCTTAALTGFSSPMLLCCAQSDRLSAKSKIKLTQPSNEQR